MLRNPNMKLKWKGDWSDSCPKWTSDLKEYVGFSLEDEGKFYMSDQDFLT